MRLCCERCQHSLCVCLSIDNAYAENLMTQILGMHEKSYASAPAKESLQSDQSDISSVPSEHPVQIGSKENA